MVSGIAIHDVARNGDDLASLEAEHCDDREEQRNERDRRDLRKEARLIPVIPLRAGQYLAGQEAGEERDAEIDQNRLGDGPEADVDHAAFEPEERRQHRSEEHTSELQSLMRISYAVFCLKTKKTNKQ